MNPLSSKPLLTPATTLAASAALLALAPLFGGDDVQVPNSFQAGTPARADEVNENFQALASAINDIPRPANRIVVDNQNGDFDSVAEALDSILDASDVNPYVVYVAPGIYSETQTSIVPPFVSLVGESAASTTVTASITSGVSNGSSSVVQVEDLGSVRGLTIENTGGSGISSALYGVDLSRETRIADCVMRVTGTGGSGHFGVLLNDSDATLVDCVMIAEGASITNAAFGSTDSGGAFAQPQLIDCVLLAKVVNSGFGLQLSKTAAQVEGCTIEGWFRGISSTVSGITRVRDSEVRTLGFSPVYEQTGSAALLSATTQFIGGNPTGLAAQFKYVHCFKSNHDPIVNGTGSTVQ